MFAEERVLQFIKNRMFDEQCMCPEMTEDCLVCRAIDLMEALITKLRATESEGKNVNRS